jgi:hypothetical protein
MAGNVEPEVNGGVGMEMTMHVNLSPEMESFIKAKVASGF